MEFVTFGLHGRILLSQNIGVFIEAKRAELGLTQAQVAKRAGVSRNTLYKWQNNATAITVANLLSLSKALRVHPIVILRLVTPANINTTVFARPRLKSDDAVLVDETVPDNSVVGCGTSFVKTWFIQNVGSVVWKCRNLVCQDNTDQLFIKKDDEFIRLAGGALSPSTASIAIPSTEPGAIAELTIRFTAPTLPGRVISFWKIVDENGEYCYPQKSGIWCQVIVTGFY